MSDAKVRELERLHEAARDSSMRRFGRIRRWLLLRLLDRLVDVATGEGQDTEDILNLMDRLVGWCAPNKSLRDV